MLVGIFCVSFIATTSAIGLDILDDVVFAQPRPHHQLVSTNSSIIVQQDATSDCQNALLFDQTFGGRVLFNLTVDPTNQNHLTIKFWGGIGFNKNGTVPFLSQSNTWLLDPTTSYTQYGWAHSWPCEIDQTNPSRGQSIDGAFPGRWQYATYPLPLNWTVGKTTLRIGLGTGVFQWYGGPEFYPSRALFKAYTHVSPYFMIPSEELQGVAPEDAPIKPADPNASAALAASVGLAVQHLFDAQVWNWTLVELGQMPMCLFGAVSQNGFQCPMIVSEDCKYDPHTHQYSNACKANVTECKRVWQASDDNGNLPWTTSLATLGQAYKSKSKWAAMYSGKTWVLDRVVGAIDVHVRAQGSNGGFRAGGRDSTGLWVGGPHRIAAGNPLEGWGHTSIARAFANVFAGMQATGKLDDTMDDDDDPTTPNITRRSAYTRLFNMSRSYLDTFGATYCPNQELGDAKGVWAANQALKLLSPSLAWSEEHLLASIVLPAIGLANFSDAMWKAKNKFPRPPGNWITISPAGISLEAIGSLAGGYSNGYSDILGDLDLWATWAFESNETLTHEALASILNKMAPAFANFRQVSNCHDPPPSGTPQGTDVANSTRYRCLKNTAFITWRNNLNADGGEKRTPIAAHTALVLKNAMYQREIQLFLQYAGRISLFDEPTNGPHWVSELLESIPLAEAFDDLVAMTPSSARMPQEEGEPDFAWADNVGRSVVAKFGPERLFLTLQWRHDTNTKAAFAPSLGKPVTSNGICRLQLTTPTIDRLATVACSAAAGDELTTLHALDFGPWVIAMNSNLFASMSWVVPAAYVGKRAVEMILNTTVAVMPTHWVLQPNQTVVVHLL
eukprot:m.57240 g.57240  ORF g.57240 m.57240 type:complete len:843 (+) comp22353_c0_seq1:83-2611(+)